MKFGQLVVCDETLHASEDELDPSVKVTGDMENSEKVMTDGQGNCL